MNNAAAEIVSKRTMADGTHVFLHADGAISSYTHIAFGGKLPVDTMWSHWEKVVDLRWNEVADFIRAAKRSSKRPNGSRKSTVTPVAVGAVGGLRPYNGGSSYGALAVGRMVDEAGNVFDMRPRACRMVAPLGKKASK